MGDFYFGRRDLLHKQDTRGDKQNFTGLVPATGPRNSNHFEFVGLVAGTVPKFGDCD